MLEHQAHGTLVPTTTKGNSQWPVSTLAICVRGTDIETWLDLWKQKKNRRNTSITSATLFSREELFENFLTHFCETGNLPEES